MAFSSLCVPPLPNGLSKFILYIVNIFLFFLDVLVLQSFKLSKDVLQCFLLINQVLTVQLSNVVEVSSEQVLLSLDLVKVP